MRFAFAGTPEFASWVLRELVELGRVPALVISQPDRPRGRGRCGSAPMAVSEAGCLGLDCIQADDINSPEVLQRLQDLGVTVLAVAAFGQLLRRPLLDALMCVNIHASLLPRHRGAAPIERALMAGDTSTGVSIMSITEGLDEGPWAERVEVSIGLRQDAGSLARVLAITGAVALAEVFDSIEDGTVQWKEQCGASSYAQKLTAADAWLDMRAGAKGVHDQVRALSPAVGSRAVLGDTEVKIWRTWPYGQAGLPVSPAMAAGVAGRPGSIMVVDGHLFLGCGEGLIEVLEIQPACRARMRAEDFLRGYSGRLGGDMKPPPTHTSDH